MTPTPEQSPEELAEKVFKIPFEQRYAFLVCAIRTERAKVEELRATLRMANGQSIVRDNDLADLKAKLSTQRRDVLDQVTKAVEDAPCVGLRVAILNRINEIRALGGKP